MELELGDFCWQYSAGVPRLNGFLSDLGNGVPRQNKRHWKMPFLKMSCYSRA
jgi:hypothetical protein